MKWILYFIITLCSIFLAGKYDYNGVDILLLVLTISGLMVYFRGNVSIKNDFMFYFL